MHAQKSISNAFGIPAFHAALHAWYARHGRHGLPWRTTRDPYAIWLSEVMLQQTQVETVLSRFYHPFLERFPTLATLAAASREEVLKAWQGLGYYSRAANLHKAAQACGGQLPREVESLLALPGIGRNTAHAVAAFAWHAPVPVMEANVRRVLHRIFALEHATPATLWEKAHLLCDTQNPFDYNQAMMDLGAQVCTPRAPACALCPAAAICQGKAAPERYPARKAKKAVPTRRLNIVVPMDDSGRVRATPRTTRFLSGMYRFTEQDETVPPPPGALALGAVSHVYSHFRLEAQAWLHRTPGRPNTPDWHAIDDLRALPHTRTEEKILNLLAEVNKN